NRENEPLLMKELIAGYWSYMYPRLPEVEVNKLRLALRPAKEMYAEIPTAKFGPVQFKAIRQKMIDAGNSINYIGHNLSAVKRMIAWGVENEMIPGEVHHRLQAVARLDAVRDGVKPEKEIEPVSDEHIEAILPHVGPPIRAMLMLQRCTGMRPGE